MELFAFLRTVRACTRFSGPSASCVSSYIFVVLRCACLLLSLRQSAYVYVYMHEGMYVAVCVVSVRLSVSFPQLSTFLAVYRSICLSVCLSVPLLAYECVCVFVDVAVVGLSTHGGTLVCPCFRQCSESNSSKNVGSCDGLGLCMSRRSSLC